jgi:hypothetical protein
MKVIKAILPVILMLCALTVQAAVEPSVKDTSDSGCVDNFSTAGCSATAVPPEPGSLAQRSRDALREK